MSADAYRAPRIWHGATATVAAIGLSVQVILVITGASVLVEADQAPALGTRVFRFFSYFTVQSNLLVLLAAVTLLADPWRDGRLWRAVRLAGLVGITVTGVVHWFFLRPLLDLSGWSFVTDKVLHVAVPLLAVAGWLLFGPRPRVDPAAIGLAMVWPLAYMVYTVVAGEVGGWYPYPFTDVAVLGYPRVAVNAGAVLLLMGTVAAVVWLVDRRLPPAPRATGEERTSE